MMSAHAKVAHKLAVQGVPLVKIAACLGLPVHVTFSLLLKRPLSA